MRLSFFRLLMLLMLAILLTIAGSACGISRSSLPEDLPPGTYLPDPIFEQFYEKNGGFDFFGYAISTIFSDETGHKYQYFETVLMVYDPIREWISFEDLGSQLGLRNLPVPAWSGAGSRWSCHSLHPDQRGSVLLYPVNWWRKRRLQ